jgi:protein SCO1/2
MAAVTRRKWLTAVSIAPFVAIRPASAWDAAPANGRPTITGRDRIRMHHLPNIALTTHTGKQVRFYDDLVKDKKVIVNFMYAKCDGICVPVTRTLARVKALLGSRVGRDIFMYSVTLKPAEDTVEDLRTYAEHHGVGDGWLFLTGTPADIDHLRRALGFAYPDPVEDADVSNHIGMVRFGVEPLTRWAACPGMGNPEHIARSILWDLD